MAFSARIESSPFAGINVTPLVDVLLVLLIIFMITAPLMSTCPCRATHPTTGPNRCESPWTRAAWCSSTARW